MARHYEGPAETPSRIFRQLGLEEDDWALIRSLPLFAGVPDDQLGHLLAGAVARRYERNAVLFIREEPAIHFFIVLEGWIRLFRETPGGQESTIGIFGRGESVAEAVVLVAGSYPVSGSVATKARLLAVPGKDFLEQLRQNPDLALNLLASMYRHLHRLVQQVEQLTSRSAVQRVADFLLRLCPANQSCAEIELPLDKALVAARLGMQPETLSRSLAKLRKIGVMTTGSRIVIADTVEFRRLMRERLA